MARLTRFTSFAAAMSVWLLFGLGRTKGALPSEPILRLARVPSTIAASTGGGGPLIFHVLSLSHLADHPPEPEHRVVSDLPSSLDWRTQGMVTPVRDQGNCGSGYAFAALANIESRLLMDGAGLYDFSEDNVKECNWWEITDRPGVGSCDYGNYEMVASFLSRGGTVLESCDDYCAGDGECEPSCAYQKTLLGWSVVPGDPIVPSTDVLKRYIRDDGPVYTAMYSSFPGFASYDGSYTLYYTGTEAVDHAALIVGWDDSLPHAGGVGGWVVKNSRGTDWGDEGYFTIAYGSARVGTFASFMSEWEDYDPAGDLLYYDEGGRTDSFGYESTTACGLVRFTLPVDTFVVRVEFWTSDATTDVDVYLYEDFDGNAPTDLLTEELNNAFPEEGYHSVLLDVPARRRGGAEVVAVVKFTNASVTTPVVADVIGPHETGRTYVSPDGADGTWYDLGLFPQHPADVGIRLRTAANSVFLPEVMTH